MLNILYQQLVGFAVAMVQLELPGGQGLVVKHEFGLVDTFVAADKGTAGISKEFLEIAELRMGYVGAEFLETVVLSMGYVGVEDLETVVLSMGLVDIETLVVVLSLDFQTAVPSMIALDFENCMVSLNKGLGYYRTFYFLLHDHTYKTVYGRTRKYVMKKCGRVTIGNWVRINEKTRTNTKNN